MPRRPDRQIFVGVDWLAAHLQDANLRIMDARMVSPTEAHPRGDALYTTGHIPGAIFVHWRQDLSTNTPPVPNRLLDAEAFASAMGQCGVEAVTTVVIYDPGDENWAARIWWALKYYGHDQVYVLAGGAAAWQEAGHPWTTTVVQPPPHDLRGPATPGYACDQGASARCHSRLGYDHH
jgi:thiosulfate/3-mercaptopyruvate sulfurtransferase